MTERFLWSPIRLGPVTVRNRIVFSAHLTNYADDGRPTEQHAAYYAARAAGGAGLIITEEHSTHPTDWPYEKLIHGFHRDVIPGYRRITDAVHRHGTPIFAQINHNGGQASSMYTRLPVWAPSPVADPLFREVPKAVDDAEIAEIVAGYALVAEHCAEGGFDGIELQCSHSSIVRGFLSPATNRRTDDYGGSLENRARLLLEIVGRGARAIGTRSRARRAALRRRADRGRHHDRRGGRGGRDGRGDRAGRLHQHLDRRGHRQPVHDRGVDARPARLRPVHPVGHPQGGRPAGRRRRAGSRTRCRPSGRWPRATATWSAWCAGQIADADFAAKARAGATDEIRLCLSCNQECVGRMGLNRWLGCIENPRTGREVSARSACAARRRPQGRDGGRRRPGRAAGRHRRRPQRPRG